MKQLGRPRANNIDRIDMNGIIVIEKPKTKFQDIIGCEDAKDVLKDFSYSLKDEDSYHKKFGCRNHRGILLHGPEGCGKTLLAQALCRNTTAIFYKVRITDLIVRWFSETEKNLRLILEDAARRAEAEKTSCIIYFDQMESIFSRFNEASRDGLTMRLCAVLREQMSDFIRSDNVYLLGCARDLDLIDQSILNPELFSCIIQLDVPTVENIKKYLEYLVQQACEAAERKNWINADLTILAKKFEGLTYSQISNHFNNVLIKRARKWKASNTTEVVRDQKLLVLRTEDF